MKKEMKFSKKEWMESKTIGFHRDLLAAVLEEEIPYTRAEAEQAVKQYLESDREGRVKE